MNFIYKTLYNW